MKVRLTVSSEHAEIVRSGIYRFISACDTERRRDAPYVGVTLMPIGDGWDCRLEFDDALDEVAMARISALLGGYGHAVWADAEPDADDRDDRPAARVGASPGVRPS